MATTITQIIVNQMAVVFEGGVPQLMTFDFLVVDSNGTVYERTYRHPITGADQTSITNFMQHILTEIQNITGVQAVLN